MIKNNRPTSSLSIFYVVMVIIAAVLFPSTANSVAPDFPGNITAVATTSGAYLNGSVTVRWSAVTGATA